MVGFLVALRAQEVGCVVAEELVAAGAEGGGFLVVLGFHGVLVYRSLKLSS